MNKKFVSLAVFAFVISISPTIYARPYGSSEDSIALPIILFIIACFWGVAIIIEGNRVSNKENKKMSSPDIFSMILSSIISIIFMFLCVFFFNFKLVGGEAVLGVIILFTTYAFIYYKVSK